MIISVCLEHDLTVEETIWVLSQTKPRMRERISAMKLKDVEIEFN